jgi:enamine deaminase RidA (YjgF/YER057c/UK114 family)
MLAATDAATTSFRGTTGGAEHFILLQPPAELPLAAQIEHVEHGYAEACAALGLPPDSAVFRRIFLSDAPNQAAQVQDSRLFCDPEAGPVAVSIVQQPPLPGAKLALLAYHLQDAELVRKQRLSPNHLLVEKNGTRHLWSTRLCTGATDAPTSTASQTSEVFANLIGTLSRQGGTLRENCVRTWIYVKDVDVFYQEMVASRTALFQCHGMTRDTHYLASTGIEGACSHRYDTVLMDAYSNLDLDPDQVSYLNDFDRLCATKDYNVTFERGTRIAYADRTHHFISGTASIDNVGRVVHPGDVLRQLGRALDNVDALLGSGGAGLGNMTHLLVYLRDPADFGRVEACVRERFSDLPVLILRGAVCRPDWLIEVEGIGITAADLPDLPSF